MMRARAQRRGTVSAALLSTLVVTGSVAVVFVPQRAVADQISGLEAQATSISQKLVQEQLQIDADQQQYSVASAKVAADARTITQIQGQIGQDQQLSDNDTRQVRQLALTSYMSGGVLTESESVLFAGDVEEAQSASEYDSIATGNIESALDQLQRVQDALSTQESTLRQQQVQDQSDESKQATDLSQADSTERAIELEQSRITGKLAAGIAARAAAQDAAAAAAIAAAQRAGTKAPGGGTHPGRGPGQTGQTGQTGSGPVGLPPGLGATLPDPALNPFLQCVVQAESGGDYQAVSPNGLYMGAFQFSQPTWNFAANDAGLPYLVGVPPYRATKAEQDTLAVALFALDGRQPWLGDRCSA
jgi:hypothetical protein